MKWDSLTKEEADEKFGKIENKEIFTLDVLSDVHDDWIKHNLNKLNDPKRVNKHYQFIPLELIGVEEARADLLFVNSIFEAANMKIKLKHPATSVKSSKSMV